ncbi:MAG: Crp/Fnr family transcriptional regulator [Leptospiraceae bacterium]|nr:Crp/Fnr family transcriptional regulator [Leptospiraceae bacterium]
MAVDLVKRFGRTFIEGQTIFLEGETGNEMYIIHEGAVTITKKARNAEQVLAVLRDGEFFGEMALFTDQKRSATAIVAKKSVILEIDRNSFDFMITNNSQFAVNMIRKLCERLKNTDNQISELLILSPETRLLKALSSYWKSAGMKDKSGELLLLPYEGFIEHVRKNFGISADDANRNLLKLKEQKLVAIRKDHSGHHFITFSPKIFDYFNIT